jgi:S1-C subfamily serine protease
VIERSLVLTAAHVVGGSLAEIKFRAEVVRGKVIALDLFHDRALVRLEKELDAKPRKFRLTDLAEGEAIFAIGYGSGFGYTPGRAASGKLRGRSVPGDSGGLIADSKGEIVGIVQGYASDGELYGHGRKSILEWVQANKGNDPIDLGNR